MGRLRQAQVATAPFDPLSAFEPEPAAPLRDAPDLTEAPPASITEETASPGIIQPGLRQYQAPVLQRPPQPWLDQSDTTLVLKALEEQGRPTATAGGSPPIVPLSDGGFNAEAFNAQAFNELATPRRPTNPLTIRPTMYPTPPGDTVTVEDPVSVDARTAEFSPFQPAAPFADQSLEL